MKRRAVGTHVGTGRSSGGSEFGPTGGTGSAIEAGSSGLPKSPQWRLEASLGTEQPLVKCKQGSLGRIFAQCTFPDDRYPPTSFQQLVPDPPVPIHVGPEFRLPEVRSGSGIGRVWVSFMMVPEAAVHETDRSEPEEHQFRPAREIAIMNEDGTCGPPPSNRLRGLQCGPIRLCTSAKAQGCERPFAWHLGVGDPVLVDRIQFGSTHPASWVWGEAVVACRRSKNGIWGGS